MGITFEIFPLPLLKKNNEKLLRCIDIIINVDAVNQHEDACLKILYGKEIQEISLGKLNSGVNRKEILFPEVLKDEELTFSLRYGDSNTFTKILLKPAKRWTVNLVLHSHTDLGFTAPISEVAQIHNDNTDLAVLYCKETAHWPEGSRFKWTCEVSWQVQNYLRDRNQGQINSFFDQVRKGNIEIAGLYSGELTELLGHEQAVRSFYYAAKLRRDYNISIETAMLCDVPGCTKGFVQIMAKSGINNFIMADNNFIAPFLARTDLPRPFYWTGDDDTRILSWYTDHPFYAYIEGQNYGLSESYSESRKKLPYKLLELEKSGYKFDEFQLQYAFDNFRIEFRPAAIVKEWNETWEFPKLKLSTAGEFLNSIRNKHGRSIPVVKGDWADWWSGIVTSFPYEAAQSRYLHNKIPVLEILSSAIMLSGKSEFPAEVFNRLYDQTLAFDEHSGSGLVWAQKSEEQQQQALSEGYGYINDSVSQAEELDAAKKQELSKLISNDSDSELIAVFNPLNFPVSGLVKSVLRETIVEGVPPLGYKLVNPKTLFHKSAVSQSSALGFLTIENSLYKVQVNRENGCVSSVFDKQLKRELINKYCNCPVIYETKPLVNIEMGKYIPEIFNGLEVPGESKEPFGTFETGFITNEAYGTILEIKHSLEDKNWLTQKIYLHDDQVFFENTFNGKLINDIDFFGRNLSAKGMIYFHFNLKLENPNVIYDAPCAVVDPVKESFKGSCKDYTAVQDWIQFHDNSLAINFSSIDAPLLELGGIALQKYRYEYPVNLQDIYVRVLSLSELNVKNKSPYTNNPDLTFRFVLSAEKKGSLRNAYEFGQKINNQLITVMVPAGNKGVLKSGNGSFFEVTPGCIHVMTIKQAESEEGIIFRLRETLGQKITAEIKIPGKQISKAFKTMITEERIQEILVSDNKLVFEMNPFSVETINVHYE